MKTIRSITVRDSMQPLLTDVQPCQPSNISIIIKIIHFLSSSYKSTNLYWTIWDFNCITSLFQFVRAVMITRVIVWISTPRIIPHHIPWKHTEKKKKGQLREEYIKLYKQHVDMSECSNVWSWVHGRKSQQGWLD